MSETFTVEDIRRLNIGPGQALAIIITDWTEQKAAAIGHKVRAALGGDVPVLVFPAGTDLAAIEAPPTSS